jgi:hypothetical protein
VSTVYPGIPQPQPDVQSLTVTSMALKSAMEILTGKTKSAAVTYSNLDQVTYNIDAYIAQQGALVEQLSTIVIGSGGTTASLQTQVDALNARVTTDETAISGVQGDTATLTTSVSVLGGTVSGLGTSVTTNATAISNINGVLSSRYSVTLNTSNKITGFSLLSDNSGASSFDIVADRFNIWATGYTNTPVFSISTIGGVAALTINGSQVADLSILTNGINNNAVSNSAGLTGAGNSGTVTITVRPGARVLALAEYDGGDVNVALGGTLTLNTSGGVSTVNIPQAPAGSFHVYYGAVAMNIQSYPSGGSVNATASVNIGTGSTSVYLQELIK